MNADTAAMPDELHLPPDATQPSSPHVAPSADPLPASELCALSGMTDKWHRAIAKRGFYPEPSNGVYSRRATMAGMFRYFRDQLAKKNGTLEKLRAENYAKRNAILDQQAEQNEIELKKARGELRSTKEFADALLELETETRALIWQEMVEQLPSVAGGMPSADLRKESKKSVNAYLLKRQQWAETWNA